MQELTMELENISTIVTNNYNKDDDDDDNVAVPGFRFHPTDEELIRFYLRRKIEKKTIDLQLIKQIDIYKYDPWDLPKDGDKECYFFCKRGRKYKNSVRPNRVTAGSGFWKATGIDRPIYSSGECIGLKKSLVYYRGSAGKGTKTDWQMHEFRLPSQNDKSTKHLHANAIPQEAEAWTLCRIMKRNASHRKSIPEWKQVGKKHPVVNIEEASSSIESANNSQIYISFSNAPMVKQNTCSYDADIIAENNQLFAGKQSSVSYQSIQSTAASNSTLLNTPLDFNEWLEHGNWDELKSLIELSFDPLF